MSITPATTATHGPFRKVTEIEFLESTGNYAEVLECSHRGRVWSPYHVQYAEVGKRRRCWYCSDTRKEYLAAHQGNCLTSEAEKRIIRS